MSEQKPTSFNFWWPLSLVIISYIAFIVGAIYEELGSQIGSSADDDLTVILKILGFYVAPAIVGWGFIRFVYTRINRSKVLEVTHPSTARIPSRMTRPRSLLLVIMITVLASVAGIFAYYVWPTPYRYDHIGRGQFGTYPVRINRFTDQVEILYQDGWQHIGSQDKP